MDYNRSISPLSRRQSSESAQLSHSHDGLPIKPYATALNDTSSPSYSPLPQHTSKHSIIPSSSLPQSSRFHHLHHFNWYSESLAILLALASTAAIVAILFKVDDKPLDSWTWSIQPASLVAVFSTIAKAALLVPVAVCVGQLKWSWFEREPRELGMLEVWDEGGRGPLGAAAFLWKTRGMVWLAGIGALVTVLMTAFEPFSQQAIHFSTRLVEVERNRLTGAWVGEADYFSDEGTAGGATFSPRVEVKLNFTIVMMEAMMDRQVVLGSSVACPGAECQYEDFSSLGVCSVCEEPETVQINNEFGCTYYTTSNATDQNGARQDFAQVQLFKEAVKRDKGKNLSSYGMHCSRTKVGYPVFKINLTVLANGSRFFTPRVYEGIKALSDPKFVTDSADRGIFGLSAGFQERSGSGTSVNSFSGMPARYCNSTFNSLYGGDSATNSSFDTLGAFTCFERTSYKENVTSLDTFGQFGATLTHCRMSLCAHSFHNVSVSSKTLHFGSKTVLPLTQVDTFSDFDNRYTDNIASTPSLPSKLYTLGPKSLTPILALVRTVLFSSDFAEFIEYRQNYTDWRPVFVPIAAAMSEFMRSPAMNSNARLMRGRIFDERPYFEVVWRWLVVPVMLVVAAMGVLGATVVKSWGRGDLYKGSVLAVVRAGGGVWDGERDEGRRDGRRETDADLRTGAEGVRVQFLRGEDGGMGFVRR